MCPQTIETTPSSEDSVTINTCVHKPSKQTRPPSQCKYKEMCPQTIKTTPSSEDSGAINTCPQTINTKPSLASQCKYKHMFTNHQNKSVFTS